MEYLGVVGLLANLDAVVQKLLQRFRNHQKNLKMLESIQTMLEKIDKSFDKCREAMESTSVQLSPQTSELRTNLIMNIDNLLDHVKVRFHDLEKRFFPDMSHQDSCISRVCSSLSCNFWSSQTDSRHASSRFEMAWATKRVARADKIFRELSEAKETVTKVEEMVNDLARLLIIVDAKPNGQADGDMFDPGRYHPDMSHTVLDFHSLSTFEGELKAILLDTEAYAVSFSAKELGEAEDLGEAEHFRNSEGLAKVEDLAKAVNNPYIRARFYGGSYVMSFEENTTETTVIEQIVKIVNSSPKISRQDRPEDYSSVEEAAHMAAENLPKAPCLLFCDDLLSNDVDPKIFQDLRLLFTHHTGSKLVVLTKNISGAALAGCKVLETVKDLRDKLLQFRKTYGISGSGGVGKTVVLGSLAEQHEIASRFKGGIYFMSFGAEAKAEHVVEEIAEIIESSNGIETARSIRNLPVSNGPKKAAEIASKWFSQKACLFLCDDLWDSVSHTGFFHELRLLATGHRHSRMVFTTRDRGIAAQADSRISFESRESISPISKGIFLQYAKMVDKSVDPDFKNNLDKLLEICGGLPLLLAVVGRKLAAENSSDDDSTRLENQVKELEGEVDILQQVLPNEYNKCLHKALMLSVEFLDKEYAAEIRTYSFAQMFHSLSILSKQGWMPISVLSRLWKEDARMYVQHFSRLSLVTLKSRSWKNHLGNKEEHEQGVMVHDLTLDICRLDAGLASNDICWHNALLSSYLEVEPAEEEVVKSVESDCILRLSDNHRAWWSDDVPEDGYIHSNLSRHLIASSSMKELWSLLLNPKWSNVWIRLGSFLPLQRGLTSLLEEMESISGEQEAKNKKNLTELQLIYRALRCAWGRIEKCPREYPYQMLGRLFDARQSMQVVHFFLKKVEENAQKPWLRPLHQCLQDPREGPETEVYFDSGCSSVAYFPCGKKVAAAVDDEVRVIDVQCGETLAKYSKHKLPVRKAAVSSSGKWLISADNQDIRVWENKTARQVGKKIVCDNSVKPNNGSLVIREGSKSLEIFATVMQGVNAWKLNSGRSIPRITDETTSYIAFSANGSELICASANPNVVRVLNMDGTHAKAEEMKCPPDCGYVSCLAASQDGKSIACGTHAGEIVFWDRNSGEIQAEELSGHRGAVTALEISKNAQLILSGSDDGGVRMWNLSNRDQPPVLIGKHSDWVTSIAVSPDSTRLVSGSRDKTLLVWDLTKATYASGRNRHPNCHSGPVTCISSCPNGRFVISGAEDKSVRVWDARNGKPAGQPFTGHTNPIEKVDVNSDSTIVYSFSGIVALCWNMENRTPCPLRYFTKAKCSEKDHHPLSLQRKGNNAVECLYKLSGEEFILAQMPTQEKCLPWHIDQDREVVCVGRQDGTIMVLKVQR